LWFEASPGKYFARPFLGEKKKKKITRRTGGVIQGVGPEFKHQYCKKKKKISLDDGMMW
jgi:hypothetical protein